MKRARYGTWARVGICFLLLSFLLVPMTSRLAVAADKKLPSNSGEAATPGTNQVAQAVGAAGAGQAAAGAAAAGAAAGVSAATLAVVGGIAAAVIVGAAAADDEVTTVHH